MLDAFVDLAGKVPALFNFFLRWIYKEDAIKDRITIDIASGASSVRAQVLDEGTLSVVLRIANYTPFDLTVENITLEFTCAGARKKIGKSNFTKIPKCTEGLIFLSEDLSSEATSKIVRNTVNENKSSPHLSYQVDFSNRLYRIQKSGGFSNFYFELINAAVALEKIKKTDVA